MKKMNNTILVLLSLIPIMISSIIILNFYNIGMNNSEFIIKATGKDEIGVVGDFFSGHINGFILLALIFSLYFQKISIEQVEKSLKEQKDANEIIRKDMKESITANTLQTKEFITTNINNDFNHELIKISQLENELNFEKLYYDRFEKYYLLNNKKLIELLNRVDYLKNKFIKIKDIELKDEIANKLKLVPNNYYTIENREFLKKLIVFNELLKIYRDYKRFILSHPNKKEIIKNTNKLNIKYEFLISNPFKQKGLSVNGNRYELFEIINCTNIFEKASIVGNDVININLAYQELWNILFLKKQLVNPDYEINKYYDIVIKDYKIEN